MTELPDDPLYRNSLRESLVAIGAWAVCGVYAITYCFLDGYGRDPAEITTVFGVPRWVVFGVFLPWLAANVFSAWYCFRFIRDEDLGEPPEAASAEGGSDAR